MKLSIRDGAFDFMAETPEDIEALSHWMQPTMEASIAYHPKDGRFLTITRVPVGAIQAEIIDRMIQGRKTS